MLHLGKRKHENWRMIFLVYIKRLYLLFERLQKLKQRIPHPLKKMPFLNSEK